LTRLSATSLIWRKTLWVMLAVLARVADPRHRRGVRHRLTVILSLAVCGVLAGARSFTAIAEWAADADRETLASLG
jgi:urease gamma subunit